MNNSHEQKELWIGLARVKQNDRNGVLGDADQAYTNVIGLAKNKIDFRSQVKQAVEALELELLRLEGAELLKSRVTESKVHKDLVTLAKKVEKNGKVGFDVFAAFDD